jgi:hypothetical protein
MAAEPFKLWICGYGNGYGYGYGLIWMAWLWQRCASHYIADFLGKPVLKKPLIYWFLKKVILKKLHKI